MCEQTEIGDVDNGVGDVHHGEVDYDIAVTPCHCDLGSEDTTDTKHMHVV